MRREYIMSQIELNKIEKKDLVLEAFDTLFNQHDYQAAEHYWSPKYSIVLTSVKSTPANVRVRTGNNCCRFLRNQVIEILEQAHVEQDDINSRR
jgi:hypothetical protein